MNSIKGGFENRNILINFFPCQKTNNKIIIFFHGANSSTLQERYFNIAKKITKNNVAHCLLYESARKVTYSEYIKSGISFEEYVETFGTKTFQDELLDGKKIITYITAQLKHKHVHFPLELHLVGVSLGGIIASYLATEFSSIKSLFLLGSGSTVSVKNNSVLKNLPSEKKILENYKQFQGLLAAVHGTKDKIIFPQSIEKVFKAANKVRYKELTFITGADHRLRTINDKNEDLLLQDIIYENLSKVVTVADLIS